jgi:hypothetical protein
MTARGERRKDGRHSNPVTVTGLKTTEELAEEAGMSAPTYKRRNAVGYQLVA